MLHFASCDHILIRDSQLVGLGSVADLRRAAGNAQGEPGAVRLRRGQRHLGRLERGRRFRRRPIRPRHRQHDPQGRRLGDVLQGRLGLHHRRGQRDLRRGHGGFSAGQGTGFSYMVSPWLHYEAYDIKVVNNVIHDTDGAGLGVNGGYNILMAYNTLYRVGRTSHAIEVVHGLRSSGDNPAQGAAYLAAGGWGTTGSGDEPIPNQPRLSSTTTSSTTRPAIRASGSILPSRAR